MMIDIVNQIAFCVFLARRVYKSVNAFYFKARDAIQTITKPSTADATSLSVDASVPIIAVIHVPRRLLMIWVATWADCVASM